MKHSEPAVNQVWEHVNPVYKRKNRTACQQHVLATTVYQA